MSTCSSVQPCCAAKSKAQTINAASDDTRRFKWTISGMDCASCASKIEKALNNTSGVSQAKVAYATERLLVDIDRSIEPEDIHTVVQQLGFSLHNSKQEAEEQPIWKAHLNFTLLAVLMTLATVLYVIDSELGAWGFTLATVVGVIPFAKKALNQIKSGTWFGIESLMTVAALGALVLGETVEAGLVLFLFTIGELLEGYAGRKARAGIKSLMALTPETAWKIVDGERIEVPVEFLVPGEILEVRPGDRLPVDAVLNSELGVFDQSALTGESIPVNRGAGEKIMAGSMVVDHPVYLEVTSEPGNSAIDRIIKLIEEANDRRAPIARMVDKFSAWYTPLVMAISGLVFVIPPLLFGQDWSPWAYKALSLLLIACPCALVVSIPAAVTSALASASRFGALIKGGAALEQLRLVKKLAFDKTGTLTEGKPKVTQVVALSETEDSLLTLTASIEQGSTHPLAKAIIEEAEDRKLSLPTASNIKVMNGRGVEGEVSGRSITVLAPRYITLQSDIQFQVDELESAGNTVVIVMEGDSALGLIAMADTLREDAVETIKKLKAIGVDSVMLTGDNRRAAAAIAKRLGIEYQAELLPEDKVKAIREIQANSKGAVAMVGDGINDAPALKTAELGIAMGQGSDVALETADAALTHERLSELPNMIKLSQRTARIVRENIILALGINTLVLLTTLFGVTGLMAAVMSDTGSTVLVTLNALRLMKKQDD